MVTRALVALLVVAGCSGPTTLSPGQEQKVSTTEEPSPTRVEAKPAGRLRITVSVDWEGAYLHPPGLAELEAFREALPHVPITHWICPAYLTKPLEDYDLKMALKSAVKKQDEIALHLHGWNSLALASGVERKEGPSFFESGGELWQFDNGDDGFELELGAYSSEEFRKILKQGRALLESTGFRVVPMFRGGAGIIEGHLFEDLVAEGFVADASLIPAQFWRTEHEVPEQLRKRVLEVWGPQDDFVAPYWIDTPEGRILELPSGPGFGDYSSLEDLVSYADAAAKRVKLHPQEDVYVHLALHQETAAETTSAAPHNFRVRVQRAIQTIQAQHGELLVFERMSDVARRHGAQIP